MKCSMNEQNNKKVLQIKLTSASLFCQNQYNEI